MTVHRDDPDRLQGQASFYLNCSYEFLTRCLYHNFCGLGLNLYQCYLLQAPGYRWR